MLFTTSWDDGYELDIKIMDLLEKYAIEGTFYVCPRKQHESPKLTTLAIENMANTFEIGAHTLRHQNLTEVPAAEAEREIAESKRWLEQTTKRECKMFCYPYGALNNQILSLVKSTGFKGARTTARLQFSFQDPCLLPTTLQVYPFPKRPVYSRWWHVFDPYGPYRAQRKRLKEIGIAKKDCKSWLSLAKALLAYGLETNQPFFHLWGHSIEMEKYKMWGQLEEFFIHVKKQENIQYVPNSGLI